MSFDSMNINRRNALILGATVSVISSTAKAASPVTSNTVLIEQTYLKAKTGLKSALIRFIESNWFAMDRKGLEAGIFTFYELLEDIDENKDWDVVMSVGYPNAEGYEDPKTKATFKTIRSEHQEIRVEGKSLKELGEIVKHHRLRLIPRPH
jgi:hypothetical protein